MSSFFCENCNENKVFDSDFTIWDIGFVWCKLWVAECPDCGGTIYVSEEPVEYFDKFETIRIGKEGTELSAITPQDRVEKGDLFEKWIQQYFLENFSMYGFSEVEGPFKRGPDFRGKKKGEKKLKDIEIERYWENYFFHGHHRSKAFDKVEFLVVLVKSSPPKNKLKDLPKNFIYIDNNHFLDWVMPKFNLEKFPPVLKIISEAFMEIYSHNCDRTRSELSLCPNCVSCAYFDNEIKFGTMAVSFLIENNIFPFTEDFRILEIGAKKLYVFYQEFILKRALEISLA